MTHDDARGDSSGPEVTLVEQGIIPAADNLLGDATAAPEMVGLVAAAAATAAAETNDDSKGRKGNRSRPWYKTPSVWWLLPITALGATSRAATIAPRTELFIKFACDELRPEYSVDANPTYWNPSPTNNTLIDVPVTFVHENTTSRDEIVKTTLHHPDKRCAQDPGIFSLLTLGWWAQYSDRAGRTKVLGISGFAILVADALLFLVAFKGKVLPGGYRILIIGGALDGLAGGFSAVIAAGHAYVADCSSPLTRSRIFSFWTGCVYAGAALGPSLGSLINSYSNNLLSTFYVTTAVHTIYGIFVAFIVPESVSDEARAKARELYERDMNPTHGRFRRPATREVAINMGSYHFKFQYALKTFHWSSVQLGHWLSLVGFWRALYLSVILPAILKALYAREARRSNGDESDNEKEAQVKRVDLLVVRVSLLIDLIGYILIGIVTSQMPFIGATILLAFGGGFAPSVQSLALALASPSAHIARRGARAHGESLPPGAKQEIGRLFGALAVIHALGAQVIGPAVYSTTFGASIGVYPRAIFWLCAIMVSLAVVAFSFVRLEGGHEPEDSEHEPLLA
ncbi:major facilitator superfamily transporter [Rhizoctonia solani]|uniref:Major facilitator superfamily transporter n=1 Tax=Rhizoctonia solani TaxID=456999 RepID=A0A8H8PB31_9AGAM|nr:major facilitator superfamily transporter [Rhizoctonia solani]QRW26991.1 major facilitator superfamily transporter [Rhizoctonia solani]